jgi:lyso-ornithine lipid O-acyltransferase
MKKIRATLRLLYFAVYTSLRISQILIVSLVRGYRPDYSMRVRRSWARHVLPAVGVRLRLEGPIPAQPCIVMCNHRSYLDPIVLLHEVLAFPVSKAEVAGWPIVGYGAKVTGILFLQRESVASRRKTLDGIAAKVTEGYPVMLFPEGTTCLSELTSDFKRGGFQLAAVNDLTIVPAAIAYGSPLDYWANESFLGHFFKRFGEPRMDIRVRFGTPMRGTDAQQLMTDTRTWIDAQLRSF